MEFNTWAVLTDIGLISVLILIGFLLRTRFKFIQRMFFPASIIGGILGLILGPNGFSILPFSDQLSSYPGILIAVVFGLLPFSGGKISWKKIKEGAGSFWAYSQSAMIFQWGLGVLFGLVVLKLFWKDLRDGFGLILASGFVGGHGTAAAVGSSFTDLGWEDASSLAMTSATVGVVSAILGGMILIKRGAETGKTSFISPFKDLSPELRTGLKFPEEQPELGKETVASISIDSLMLHIGIAAAIAMGGYYFSSWGSQYLGEVSIPEFSVAFIIGVIINWLFKVTKSSKYISEKTLSHISGTSTDLLVGFGIASISLPIVIKYATPLIILFIFGLIFCLITLKLAPKFFESYWFEKGMFSWGFLTGTMAMGIALLRILDPEQKSKTLDDYSIAYLPQAPVEIIVVTFAPIMIMAGQSWLFVGLSILFG